MAKKIKKTKQQAGFINLNDVIQTHLMLSTDESSWFCLWFFTMHFFKK